MTTAILKNSLNLNKTKTFEKIKRRLFFTAEDMLLALFEEERKKEKSIICSYKPWLIAKLAVFICTKPKNYASIGIAGETASGKSTITEDIIEMINKFSEKHSLGNLVTRINTDDYYYDRSEMVKAAGSFAEFAKNYDLDTPHALELDLMQKHIRRLLNGESVMLPKYDMSGTAIRIDNCVQAYPAKVIISEGLFNLTEKIAPAYDFKIYIDIDKKVQEERFFRRAEERGLGASAKDVLFKADRGAKLHIRPSKERADLVLSGEADRNLYKEFVAKIFKIIEDIYY